MENCKVGEIFLVGHSTIALTANPQAHTSNDQKVDWLAIDVGPI